MDENGFNNKVKRKRIKVFPVDNFHGTGSESLNRISHKAIYIHLRNF